MPDSCTSITVTEHRGPAELARLRPAWNDLLGRAGHASPHMTPAWITAVARRDPPRGRVIARGAWCGETLVGLLIYSLRRRGFGRIAEMVGRAHPGYQGIVTDAGCPDAPAALARHCAEHDAFDAIVNENLSARDEGTLRFLDELEHLGFVVHRVDRAPCWWMRLDTTLDAYLQRTQSPRTRKKTRQYQRKLQRHGTVTINRYRGPGIDHALMQRVAAIQAASWLRRRHAAVFADPAYRQFVVDLGAGDLARIWVLQLDGWDVAFAIATVCGRNMVYEWIAFRLECEHLRVGKLLTMQVLADACDAGLHTFDFSHGDGDYKAFWGADRHLVHRAVAGRGLTGAFAVRAYRDLWRLARHPRVRKGYHRIRHALQTVQRRAA